MKAKAISRILKLAALFLFCWYALPRACTTVRFAGQIHKPALNRDFSGLSDLLPGKEAKAVRFHLGLPHHGAAQRNEFLHAIWLTPTITFHGYFFQRDIWIPEAGFVNALAELLKSPASFSPYSEGKACGGFHPDFIVRFEDQVTTMEMIVCMSCGEILVFSQGEQRMMDLTQSAFDQMEKLWQTATKTQGA